MLKRKRLGLALGGGGARGLSHIGVLKVLEKEFIPIDILVGTSIGALVGAAYASGTGPEELEGKTDEFLKSDIFQNSALKSIKEIEASDRLTVSQKIQAFFKDRIYLAKAMFRAGMLQSENFQAMIDFFIPDIDIRDTHIPFRAAVTDLVSGQPVVISEGSLRNAVMASCAVPGAVAPLEKDNMLLSDGGIVNLVPTSAVRKEGAAFVIAVSVNSDIRSEAIFSSAVDIYVRAAQIGIFHLECSELEKADVVIRPQVGRLHWTDFLMARDLVREGERAAYEELSQIRKALPILLKWSILARRLSRRRAVDR